MFPEALWEDLVKHAGSSVGDLGVIWGHTSESGEMQGISRREPSPESKLLSYQQTMPIKVLLFIFMCRNIIAFRSSPVTDSDDES